MASYTPIPDDDVDAESPGTTTLITLLRDNPIGIAAGSPGAPKIQAAALDTDSVETAKIKALNVTEGKIGTGAVTEGKLGSFAVTEGKIGTGAVTKLKIGTAAVSRVKLDFQVIEILNTQHAEVGSEGNVEFNLMSYTMPANTMADNGARLRITAYFKGQGAKLVVLKFYFGGTQLSILVVATPAAIGPSGFNFRAIVDVVRITASTQAVSALAHDEGGLVGPGTARSSPAESSSSQIIMKFTGQNVTDSVDNAVVQQYMQVESLPD